MADSTSESDSGRAAAAGGISYEARIIGKPSISGANLLLAEQAFHAHMNPDVRCRCGRTLCPHPLCCFGAEDQVMRADASESEAVS